MEYKRIEKDNYTLHLVNTNRFKSMNIVLFFTKKFDKKDLKYAKLLTSNMVYTSKKYNTKSLIATKGEDLYGTLVGAYFDIIGNCEQFTFTCDFLNPKYTEDRYLDESIDFFNEIVCNPNIEDNGFKEEYFNIIKNDLISANKSKKDNPSSFASIEYNKLIYKGTPNEYDILPSVEDLENSSNKELYSFYKELFNKKYNIDLFIYGELREDIIEIVDNKFKYLNGVGINNDIKFQIKNKSLDKLIEKTDTLKFNQSKLYMGYKLNDLNYHELYHVMKVYNTILGTMNDSILFNIVREENSLCYSVGSFYSRFNPALTIYAGINKENANKTIDLIKKCVELMSDEKEVGRLFDSAKKTINTYINDYYDDCTTQINKFFFDKYEYGEDIETYRESINSVSIMEVCKLNEKIKLNIIYLLKGDSE